MLRTVERKLKHINSIDDIKIYDIYEITSLMTNIKGKLQIPYPTISNKLFGLLFFEPSTRTHCSFKAAITNLGANYIDLPDNSSSKKGESDLDTVRTFMEYCDCLVIRHPEIGFVNKCIEISTKFNYSVNIINAGDGAGEHPTQAINDLLFINNIKYKLIKKTSNEELTITITGDIDNGRAVHSLKSILTKINLKSEDTPSFKQDKWFNIQYITDINDIHNVKELLSNTDVLYMTRTQTERGSAELNNKFILTKDLLNCLPRNSVIMHPLPRRDELPEHIDSDPRALYFEQAGFAVYSRMALLIHLLV